jgi:DNA-binding HxlR family transcriptional regulator
MARSKVLDPNCSIARSLGVLGELWTFLILREAMDGVTRFAQFRDALGIAPDRLPGLHDRQAVTDQPKPGARCRQPVTAPG